MPMSVQTRLTKKQIAGITVDQLPKSNFAQDMAIGSRRVAQYWNASEPSGSCTNMNFRSDDGTSQHGRLCKTFDVINKQGILLACGRIRSQGPSD